MNNEAKMQFNKKKIHCPKPHEGLVSLDFTYDCINFDGTLVTDQQHCKPKM